MNKFILSRLNDIMNNCCDNNTGETRWFYCFGTLQEYVVASSFDLKHDIDIGVLFGNPEVIQRSFESYGYKLNKIFRNNINQEALNLHFVPNDESVKHSPVVDVYFWINKGDIWYHTYDINMEGSEIPREYVFKGIKFDNNLGQGFYANRDTVDEIYTKNPLGKSMMTQNGIWQLSIFDNSDFYKFYLPYSYGYCLDQWYDNWKFRGFNIGQSLSKFIKKVKNCGQL